MKSMDDIDKALRLLRDRGAEVAALENVFRELTQTLVDLLMRVEARDGDGLAGPLAAAMQGVTFPAPVVNVHPTVGARAGDSWSVKLTRTMDGASMVVTKI